MFDAVPMLQTGIASKLFHDRSVKYRTANVPQLLDAGMEQGIA